MIPFLTVEQIRAADQYTIDNEPISAVNLMERAAKSCADYLIDHFNMSFAFHVYCGPGNNGGDGLVIARLLLQKGYKVSVFIFSENHKRTLEFEHQLNLLMERNKDSVIRFDPDQIPEVTNETIAIDALFGIGMTRKVEGDFENVILRINESYKKIIAIDLPSGIFADEVTPRENPVVKATITLTFQVLKYCIPIPENGEFIGEIVVLDIGLDKKFIQDLKTDRYLMQEQDVSDVIEPRTAFSHKGKFGHALLLAGSDGKYGAAIMAARSCLRSGIGLLTVQIPSEGVSALNVDLPEAMTCADDEKKHLSALKAEGKFTAIGVGPGIGVHEDTQRMLKIVLQQIKIPLVIDADGLNILSENKTWLGFLAPNTILTPHIGEFERLFGKSSNHFERLELLRSSSIRFGITIVLKGKFTCIATADGKMYFNPTGNPGMAKGGSGDVLTGMLTALVAQGYTMKDAAVTGVFLHGRAADLCLDDQSMESVLASDVIEKIGAAFQSVLRNK